MSALSKLTPEIKGLTPSNASVHDELIKVTYSTPGGVDLDPFRIAYYANALGINGFSIKQMMTKTRSVQVVVSIEFICEKPLWRIHPT